MIMMILLVVVVDGARIEEQFMFRYITRGSLFAPYIGSGKVKVTKGYQKQKNITAYCIPKYAKSGTKTWD